MTSISDSASIHQTTILQHLQREIEAAVNATNDVAQDRFLSRPDLHRILNLESLSKLYYELLRSNASDDIISELGLEKEYAKTIEQQPDSGYNRLEAANSMGLDTYARKTHDEPSRLYILALLVYDRRKESLIAFTRWLFMGEEFPSDKNIPFCRDTESLSMLPKDDHEYVLMHQAMFNPFTIKEFAHQKLPFDSRKPFLGKPQHLKDGASGAVYKVKIAAGHWQYEKFRRPTDNRNEFDVAVKMFRERPEQAATSAEQDYNTERKVLSRIRKNENINASILLDWGGLVEDTSFGKVHSLFFEWADCDLEKFLESREWSDLFMGKSVVLSRAIDILGALAFLHDQIHSLHLDIKPDNILVFFKHKDPQELGLPAEAETKKVMEWKITDFNLSQPELRKYEGNQFLELSSTGPYESTVPSARVAGTFQAPEIQDRNESPASEKSDVWSMGSVLLMVLAFLCKGSNGVKELQEHTIVRFKDVTKRLFYLTKDDTGTESTLDWPGSVQTPVAYLDDFSPEISKIRDGLVATVHPRVLEWSESVYENADEPEKTCLKQAFGVIFQQVLVIDRYKRSSASDLHKLFLSIGRRYTRAKGPTNAEPYPDGIPLAIKRISTASPPAEDDDPSHSNLCMAITEKNASEVTELLNNQEDPNVPCQLCKKYPICRILRCRADQERNRVIEALLRPRSPAVIETCIRSPNKGPAPLEIACAEPGDTAALRLLFECRGSEIPIDDYFDKVYKSCKGGLNFNSKSIIKQHKKAWKHGVY